MAERSTDFDQVNIAAALFSDAAAAFVLCNEYAMAQDEEVTPQFELLEWGCDLVPGTAQHMTFYADIDGLSVVVRSFKENRLIDVCRLSSETRSRYSQIHPKCDQTNV